MNPGLPRDNQGYSPLYYRCDTQRAFIVTTLKCVRFYDCSKIRSNISKPKTKSVLISSFPKTNLISEWSQSNVPAVSSGVSSAFYKFNLLKKNPSMFLAKSNLVSGNATKHIVDDNINATKHYVDIMVRFGTLFFRVVESFPLFLGSLIVNYGITIYFWIFPIIRFVALQFFIWCFDCVFFQFSKKEPKYNDNKYNLL